MGLCPPARAECATAQYIFHGSRAGLKKRRLLESQHLRFRYVGAVSAGCLAQEGHEVLGVDRARTKVELINAGQSPIIEAEIGEIIAASVRAGRLRAIQDPVQAIRDTDLSFVCVGTQVRSMGTST